MGRSMLALGMMILAFSILVQPVRSQDLDFKSAYDDYLLARDIYRKEYSGFQKERDFYLQTKTLVQKENIRRETFQMLTARDELMAVYLTAIQTRLQQTPGGEGNEKTDILSNLAGDVVWWRQYKNVYSQDNDAQEVLLTKSDEGKRHYEETSNRFIYETLSTISFSKFRDTKTNLENIYRQINPKTLGADGARRALFDRWVADIEAEFQKVTDIESEIGEIRKEFDAKSKPSDVYLKLIAKVSEGKDSFLAIIGFLSELLAATNLNNGQ